MNKLAIPAILVSVVMIAGIFAFMPVDKAVTVHQQIIDAILAGQGDVAVILSGGHTVRIATTIDNVHGNGNTIWTQIIQYDRTNSSGTFQIEKLYLCNLDNDDGFIEIGFDVETDVTGTGISPGKPSLVSSEDQPIITGLEPSFDGENECVDLRTIAHNFDGENLTGEVGHTFLGGDDRNNVQVRLQDSECDLFEGFREATLVAYISGILDADTEMIVTPFDDLGAGC